MSLLHDRFMAMTVNDNTAKDAIRVTRWSDSRLPITRPTDIALLTFALPRPAEINVAYDIIHTTK